ENTVGVLLSQDSGEKTAVLQLDGPFSVRGFHRAIGIEHTNEQLRRPVRAHAIEHRADLPADLAKFMAHAAILDEQLLAVLNIARLEHNRRELGDELVLFLQL